jgi:trans-aconitate 2-methyltransferase
MIRQARESGIEADWSVADIAAWAAVARYDVVYSNAALQWVGEQTRLLPRLMQAARPGGVLAFQVPMNFDMPSHALMREVAGAGSWAAKLRGVRNIVLMSAEQCFDLLEPHAAALDIWETEYLQVMEGPDAIYRWVSGTGLRPFVQALDGEEREAFVEAYKARLNAAYPVRESGKTLFPFRRLFVVAQR